MTHTHYFPHAYATAEIISDAKDILATTHITICGPTGSDEPVFDLTHGIMLNGDALFEEDYETFHLIGSIKGYAGTAWYCKTQQKPYDTVVAAILISAHLRTGISFATDGTWDEWKPAVALYEAAVRPLTADEKIGLEMIVESLVYIPTKVRNRRPQG